MPPKKRQVVIGRYGRPKRKIRRFNFRLSRKILYIIIPVLAFFGILYFFFVSDMLEVKEVNISGLKVVSEEEVRNRINDVLGQKKFGILKSKNYFLLSRNKLQSSILVSLPKISSVRIEKTMEALNIALEEREAIGIWCLAKRDKAQADVCFYFDKEGVIFEESPKSSGSLFMSIEDMRDVEPNIGGDILSESEILLSREAQRLANGNFSFGVKALVITGEGGYELLTTDGWRALLSTSDSLEYQLSNLKYVLDEKIKTRRGDLE
ncbi:MAG: FtsQ-type POTRA domain-containing protein, partial [Candidatus Spechtbacterales bacterium]